ncbi:hypothetical protein BC941DRAFT_437045 [Chlamydoabsidia padenii]|nr:hypothetical protein BC941DRAFT_437045 [Chlamydoabsidia padenii]
MAFAQAQQRPRHYSQKLAVNSEDESTSLSLSSTSATTLTGTPVFTSDSETDWNVIGSSVTYSPRLTTPLTTWAHHSALSIESSEPESFVSLRPSDTDSYSDNDIVFDTLPSHDGTGAFTMDPEPLPTSQQQQQTGLSTSFHDFEPNSPSMPNILLPYGGIHLPSFVTATQNQSSSPTMASPTFQPTVIAKDIVLSSDEQLSTTGTRPKKANSARKRSRNLDYIPTHHPSLSGSITSLTVLSAIWNNLRRLTNHLIENDTSTVNTFSSLASEATFEGFLPFGSHLHMDLATGRDYINRREQDADIKNL